MNPPLLPLLRKSTPTQSAKQDPKKAEKTFDELRKNTTQTAAVRRPAPVDAVNKTPEAKRLREEDIEGFKELLAEQRRRSELAAEQGDDTTTYDAATDVGLDDWDEEDEEEDQDMAAGVSQFQILVNPRQKKCSFKIMIPTMHRL